MSNAHRPFLYLLIVAVFVHGCALAAVYRATGRIDTFAFRSLDSQEYYQIARNVAEHGTFSQSTEPPRRPDTWRTPGYPLFLAGVMLVGGGAVSTLIAAQQILGVLNVLLLYGITRRQISDRRAIVVAWLFLMEPYHLYYSMWLMATTLFLTLLLITWLIWQIAAERRQGRWFLLLGVSAGLLILVRPVAILIPPVLLVGLLWRAWQRRGLLASAEPSAGTGRFALSYVLGVAVVLSPWLIRNQVVAGHFALSDQSGVVLAYFKATEVVLWGEGRADDRYAETSLDPNRAEEPHTVWDRIDAELPGRLTGLTEQQRLALNWRNLAQGNRTTVDSFELSRALRGIGLSYLAARPFSTLTCYLTRCGSILTFPMNLAFRPPKGTEPARLRSALLAGPYVLLFLGVVAGLVRRRFDYDAAFFPLACTVALLLATAPQIDPRFRVPMIPLLILLALLPGRRAPVTKAGKVPE